MFKSATTRPATDNYDGVFPAFRGYLPFNPESCLQFGMYFSVGAVDSKLQIFFHKAVYKYQELKDKTGNFKDFIVYNTQI